MPLLRGIKQMTEREASLAVDSAASHPTGSKIGTITTIDLFAGAGGLSRRP